MIVDQWSANISEIVNQWDIATFRQADSCEVLDRLNGSKTNEVNLRHKGESVSR